MRVNGSYHEIAVFLDRLSKMPRIVNVTDLNMTKPRIENKKIVLDSEYLATTYRFLEQPSGGAKAAGPGPKLKKK
jgi:type IV pilus assembly protein PilO